MDTENMSAENGNGSASNNGSDIHSHLPEAYVVPVVFALIFIAGVLGNVTLIYTVLRNHIMRSTPNIFLVSLALGDLLLIVVSVPFTAYTYLFKEWYFGTALCKLNEFFQTLSLGVSVFTLTALSGDRYVAIVHPLRKHKGSKTRRTLLIACMIWLLSISLAVLELFGANVDNKGWGGQACNPHPAAWGVAYAQFHTVFRFAIYFVLPMAIITCFYLLMARELWQKSQETIGAIAGRAICAQARQMEHRKTVAKLVLSFILVFMVCWLPRHIYLFWYFFDPSRFNGFWQVFKILSFCLCFTNSCINPLALYLLSQQFRHYYNRYLFCCCCRPVKGIEYTPTLNMRSMLSNTAHRNGTVHCRDM